MQTTCKVMLSRWQSRYSDVTAQVYRRCNTQTQRYSRHIELLNSTPDSTAHKTSRISMVVLICRPVVILRRIHRSTVQSRC